MERKIIITIEEDKETGREHIHRHIIGMNIYEAMGLLRTQEKLIWLDLSYEYTEQKNQKINNPKQS